MKLAKMILHYATDAYTRSLLRQVPDAIVVDNGSPRPFQGARIRQPDLGFTRGWNTAIRSIYGEFDAFLLMNNDIDITQETIRRLVTILEKYPRIGIISAAYNSYHKLMRPPKKRWLFPDAPSPANGIRYVPFVELTAPIIRKTLFDAIGLFDERFVKGYRVDYDFAYRTWSAGFSAAVFEGATFHHHEHRSIKSRTTYFRYRRTAVKEMRRELKKKYGKDFFRADAFPFWNIGKQNIGQVYDEND